MDEKTPLLGGTVDLEEKEKVRQKYFQETSSTSSNESESASRGEFFVTMLPFIILQVVSQFISSSKFLLPFSPIPACLLLFQDIYYLGHSHCLTVDNNFPQASIGLCASLQATFYPLEAAKKGSTTAQFGAVFGIIHLSLFVFGPLVGKYLPLWGVHCIFFAGFVIDGGSFLLFGLLQWVDDNTSFLVLAHIQC